MTWKLTSDRFTRMEGGGPVFKPTRPDQAGQEAKAKLHEMALELVGKNGEIKSGYLKLAHSKDGLTLGRRWMGANSGTQDAHALVNSLIETAYADKPAARQAAQEALQRYMGQSGNRLGTHSFVHLVRVLEEADGAPAEGRLARAAVKDDARLNLQGMSERFKIEEVDQRLASLRQQLHSRPDMSPADQVMLRRNAMALAFDLPPLLHDDHPLRAGLQRAHGDIENFRAPHLPIAVNLAPFKNDTAVHALLDLALRGTPATQSQRLEVVKNALESTRKEWLNTFNHPDYFALVGDLHAQGTPQAQIAIQELRALEAALVQVEVDEGRLHEQSLEAYVPSQLGLPEVKAAEAQAVRGAAQALTQAASTQDLGKTMVGLRQFGVEVRQAISLHEQTLHQPFKSEDDRKEFRDALIGKAVAALDDRAAAELLQSLLNHRVDDLAGVTEFMVASMARPHMLPEATVNAIQLRDKDFSVGVDVLMQFLTMKVRGHQQNSMLVARPFSKSFWPGEFTAAQRQALWQAHLDDPEWSRLEMSATLSAAEKFTAKTRPTPLEKGRFRDMLVKTSLDKLMLTQPGPRAQMAQLLSHPGSFDPQSGDALVYLMSSASASLLEAREQAGQALSDAQIWKAVMGEEAPADLTSHGDPQLAKRMSHAVAQRFQAALEARGRSLQDLGPVEGSGIPMRAMMGLAQGISWRTQVSILQDPTHPLTLADFHPGERMVRESRADASNAYGLTRDIQRWEPPSQFIFEEVPGHPKSTLDPNNHPGLKSRQAGANPRVDDPVIVDLQARIRALASSEEQINAVSMALTQASTMIFRTAAESLPLVQPHPQIEHGSYTFTLSKRDHGDISVVVSANAAMPFEGELHLVVTPQGQIDTERLMVRGRRIEG